MKTRTLKFLAALALAGCADAHAAQQIDTANYRCPADAFIYGARTDGVCYHRTKKVPVLVSNGEVTVPKDSPVWFEDFEGYSDGEDVSTFQLDGTAFDGTADVVNLLTTTSGMTFGYSAIVGQTLDLDMDAGSLDVGADQNADDGYMIWTGYAGATGRPFVIGRDAAFKTCLKFAIEDVSGTDDFHFGFRRAEVANATFDNYNDLASLGFTVADGTIDIETINDNASTTTTATGDSLADATTTTWCVLVSAAGAVTYTIDGAAPTTTAAFSFDDGDPVVPFLDYLQDTALTGEIDLYEWETNWQ